MVCSRNGILVIRSKGGVKINSNSPKYAIEIPKYHEWGCKRQDILMVL